MRRIVSLVPSITETLCTFGLQNEVVGCTSFCVEPMSLRHTSTSVGGTKDARFDDIVALKPTHVFADTEENSASLLRELEKICEVIEYFPKTVSESIEMVLDMGRLLMKSDFAEAWAAQANTKLQQIKKDLDQTEKKATFSYFIWQNPWMVSGDKTYISRMLEIINLQNQIVTGERPEERYPVVEAIDARILNSDFLFFSSEPFPFKNRHIEAFRKESGFKGQALKIDGQLLSWYGTRTLEALNYLEQLSNSVHQIKK